MIKKIVLFLIGFYQRVKSLFLIASACRFQPSCSRFCYQAIEKYGIIKGSWQCFCRVLRCHPIGKTRKDPVK